MAGTQQEPKKCLFRPFSFLLPSKDRSGQRVSDLLLDLSWLMAELSQARRTSGSFSAIWTGWHPPSAAMGKPLPCHPAHKAHAVFCPDMGLSLITQLCGRLRAEAMCFGCFNIRGLVDPGASQSLQTVTSRERTFPTQTTQSRAHNPPPPLLSHSGPLSPCPYLTPGPGTTQLGTALRPQSPPIPVPLTQLFLPQKPL